MSTLTANIEERVDHVTEERLREQIATENAVPESTAPLPSSTGARLFERVSKRFSQQHLVKLAVHRGDVTAAWRELPDRMHRVANQTKLVLELVDDFRSGTYRKVPWHTIAVGAGALLYAANPADVLPDALIGLGQLDDIAVLAIALRVMRKDLREYCEHKGYSVEDYFPAKA